MNSFDCESVLEQLSEYLDSDARDELCQAIAAHLSRCPGCRVMVDKTRKTIVLYQHGSSYEVPMPMRATAALTEAMRGEYAPKK